MLVGSGGVHLGRAWGVGATLNNREKKKRANTMIPTDELAENLLSILVMDLGYDSELPPRYGHHPMRHQFAWDKVEEVLGKERMEEEIKLRIESLKRESEFANKVNLKSAVRVVDLLNREE